MDWLSKIDPNLIAGAIAAILALLKSRKDQGIQAYLAQAIKSALDRAVLDLIDRELTGDKARAELEAAAAAALARAGIKRNAVIDAMLHAAIEAALGRLESYLFRRRAGVAAFADATDKLADGAQKVLDAFTPSEEPTIPRLGLNIEVLDPYDATPLPPAPFEEVREPAARSSEVYGEDPDEPAAAAAAKVRAAIAKDPPR